LCQPPSTFANALVGLVASSPTPLRPQLAPVAPPASKKKQKTAWVGRKPIQRPLSAPRSPGPGAVFSPQIDPGNRTDASACRNEKCCGGRRLGIHAVLLLVITPLIGDQVPKTRRFRGRSTSRCDVRYQSNATDFCEQNFTLAGLLKTKLNESTNTTKVS
jgi:hypothetical protein